MLYDLQLSDRAKLGSIILQSIKLGESLSDRMAVELIAERLRYETKFSNHFFISIFENKIDEFQKVKVGLLMDFQRHMIK